MKSLFVTIAAMVGLLASVASADITRPTQHRNIIVTDATGETDVRLGFWVGHYGTFVYGADLEAGDVLPPDVQIAPASVQVRNKASVAAFMATLGADRLGFPVNGTTCPLGRADRDPDAARPANCFPDDGLAGVVTLPNARFRDEPRDNF